MSMQHGKVGLINGIQENCGVLTHLIRKSLISQLIAFVESSQANVHMHVTMAIMYDKLQCVSQQRIRFYVQSELRHSSSFKIQDIVTIVSLHKRS